MTTTGFSPETKFESRIDALARERRKVAEETEAAELLADSKGELWTLQAALKPGGAFCLLYRGVNDDTEAMESQHGAFAILGPVRLIGTKKEAMMQAMRYFVVDEITIRAIG